MKFPISNQLTGLFGDIEQLSLFIRYLKPIHLPAQQFLFRQGDLADGIYLVISGQVSAVEEQMSHCLQTFGSGEFLGEGECLFNLARLVSVIADQPSEVYHLSNQAWKALEQEAPAIATELLHYLLGLLAIRIGQDERSQNQPTPFAIGVD